MISIHALREEGDRDDADRVVVLVQFLSTPSARRATLSSAWPMSTASFLSTPSARRATDAGGHGGLMGGISIHALREEGDPAPVPPVLPPHNFYPRPPRGGRLSALLKKLRSEKFLSTPSARRATAKTETKSLFSNKLYNILHEFRRALIYNGSKNYPNHAK